MQKLIGEVKDALTAFLMIVVLWAAGTLIGMLVYLVVHTLWGLL